MLRWVGLIAAAGLVTGCSCGGGDDAGGVECGPGTMEENGLCVPTDTDTTTCGAGTVLDEGTGECVPDPDLDGPAAPTGLSATPVSGGIDLTWANPTDADFAEVVLVRTVYRPVDHRPVPGTSYGAGDLLAPTEEIVYVGGATTFMDVPPPGVVYYALFAADGEPNYSGPVTAHAVMPAGPQTAQITIELTASPQVTITAAPDDYAVTATARRQSNELQVSIGATSLIGRVVFAPKLVVGGITEGVLQNGDGTLGGDEFVRMGVSIDYGATGAATLVFDNVDGTPSTIVLDLTIVDSPLLIRNRQVVTDIGLELIDTGALEPIATIPCTDLPRPVGQSGGCGVRPGALSANGRLLYAGLRNEPALVAIDMASLSPAIFVPLADSKGYVDAVVANPAGTVLYATLNTGIHGTSSSMDHYGGRADSTAELVRLAAGSLEETGRVTVQSAVTGDTLVRARGPYLSPAGDVAAVPVSSTGEVHLYDLTTFTEIDTDDATSGVQPVALTTSDWPRSALFTADGTALLIGFGGQQGTNLTTAAVDRIDLAGYAVSALSFSSTPTDGKTAALARAPDGSVWIGRNGMTGGDGNALSVFDDALASESRDDPGGTIVDSISFSPDGSRAFVLLREANQLAVYDTAGPTRIDTDGAAGNGVTNLAVDRVGQHGAFVTPF